MLARQSPIPYTNLTGQLRSTLDPLSQVGRHHPSIIPVVTPLQYVLRSETIAEAVRVSERLSLLENRRETPIAHRSD